jgi:hypothetical protein
MIEYCYDQAAPGWDPRMWHSGNQRFAYRCDGSHFVVTRKPPSILANIGRRVTLKSQPVAKVSRMHLREICQGAALRRDEGQP